MSVERFFIDSWAWIEYFAGYEKGREVHDIITSESEIITSVLNEFEVFAKIFKLRGKECAQEALDFIEDNATIVHLNRALVEDSASLRAKQGTSTVDAIVAASALKYNATILTGDSGFKQIQGLKVKLL